MNDVMRQIDALLADISVKGEDVFKMVRVRQLLKSADALLTAIAKQANEATKEAQDGGQQTDQSTPSSE